MRPLQVSEAVRVSQSVSELVCEKMREKTSKAASACSVKKGMAPHHPPKVGSPLAALQRGVNHRQVARWQCFCLRGAAAAAASREWRR